MKYLKNFNESLSASDYTIFKIRYYSDGINVSKGKFEGDDKQHWERGKEYNSFFWKMVEKVTNRTFKDWIKEYSFYPSECATEELFEKYKIYIPESEEFYYWYIPNTMTDIIEWIKSDCKLPFTIAIRAPYNRVLSERQPTTWRRDKAREFTIKNLSNLPQK